uniref:Uncharacterized protein n=1 Tax=Amphimedon queenslandica TaxID=400682 RepID=A0A1X7UUI1_AMPQE
MSRSGSRNNFSQHPAPYTASSGILVIIKSPPFWPANPKTLVRPGGCAVCYERYYCTEDKV